MGAVCESRQSAPNRLTNHLRERVGARWIALSTGLLEDEIEALREETGVRAPA